MLVMRMLNIIDAEKATKTMERYFDLLRVTGYVKRPAVIRYLVYAFLADFTDVTFDYMSEADYNKIDRILSKMFSTGCCLMPYPVCTKRYVFGQSDVMGTPPLRSTEDKEGIRNTEDYEHRIME